MNWSETYLFTLKESPSEAEIISHKLLIKSGFIRKVSSGVFTYGAFFLKALKKANKIIREELESVGCTEILMPVLQPKELWVESGRWDEMGKSLQKFKNRNDQNFCLGPTHEEVITDYVRRDIKSYRDLPKTLYQIQNKIRDEIRPRFGLMRGKEFLMKDAYSFDVDKEKALESYYKLKKAYKNIFDRIGFRYCIVRADAGAIGGELSEEFHVLADNGEDEIFVSEDGKVSANKEICPVFYSPHENSNEKLEKLEKFETPQLKTIRELSKSLKVPEKNLVKTMFYLIKKQPACFILRGDDDVNEFKIKNFFKLPEPPRLLNTDEIKSVTKGASPGSCGPVGLDIPIYADQKLKNLKNFVVGANEDNFHYKNVNTERDFSVKSWFDFCFAKEGELSETGSTLKLFRGIEVGHIFYLGTKYSQAMKAEFLNEKGKSLPIEMGCYGIGVSRLLQASIEQNHDKDGMIWPMSLAPYEVHICHLDPDSREASNIVNDISKKFKEKGLDVFIDDRPERPGIKFKDADLLGFPLRITVGKKGLEKKEVEWCFRAHREKKSFPIDKMDESINLILKELKK